MMKDMKWKQIDTTYAGKAFQVEAREINLHGEVDIVGSLTVNGGSVSAPTASDVSYDNTTSGLTADDVQDAVDELAGLRVKSKTFDDFNDLVNWILSNNPTVLRCQDNTTVARAYLVSIVPGNVRLSSVYWGASTVNSIIISGDGTNITGYFMNGNNSPSSNVSPYADFSFTIWYV